MFKKTIVVEASTQELLDRLVYGVFDSDWLADQAHHRVEDLLTDPPDPEPADWEEPLKWSWTIIEEDKNAQS